MVGNMRGSGRRIVATAGDSNGTPIIIPTSAPSRMEKRTAKVCTSGATVRSTMVNGAWASNMDMVCGRAQISAIRTLESGGIPRLKGTAFINGKTETDMKENGSSV